ncbi:methyltransferase [Mycobacterium marinum]|uniref:DNA-methyltransferase n=1 Tax=Mycobacterium marinum TaxID=1781 RepID=UPI000CD95F40|nr:DNA methyltransferase [Mycobacterium marinum]AXN50971.1 Modification methylase DpnIIB [Mycobacterium marinum]RFZ25432.1 Modification methylase DpnIIB [Mycobacterium marinum]RFZ28318.1 Modification methylase DpnIIB [Mycobacterium marinum]RFZ33854.1 Modification methylase DpnIIB [Mycobacterium marinum]WOR03018.1 DNA methyltransferase [Mycobacterium marinum]
MTAPYYQDDQVTLYLGDSLEITEWLTADVLVTDPPYGIAYKSGRDRPSGLAASIAGDEDTSLRDGVLIAWNPRPALVFGTWRINRPAATRARLIWDTKGALGMGDLSIPWKPSDQEIYVIGSGFRGHRGSNVISCAPLHSTSTPNRTNARQHPHQKPVSLLERLIDKCPPGVIADPFAGSGSTLIAARNLGRKAIGVEIEERYCEIVAKRLDQLAFDFGDHQ